MSAKTTVDVRHTRTLGPKQQRRGLVPRGKRKLAGKAIVDEVRGVVMVKYGQQFAEVDRASLARIAKRLFSAPEIDKPKPDADAAEILALVEKWAGGQAEARRWYRSFQIPSFGDRTAEALVQDGKAAAVRNYIDRIALGGFA